MPESQARRARNTGHEFRPDYTDVPAVPRYLQGIETAGARIRHVSRWMNAASVEVDEAGARRIAALPYVRRIAPVLRTQIQLGPPGDYGSSLGQNQGVNAVAAHDSGYSAAGVVVALFDTGFRKDHVALAPLKRLAEWDFVNSDGQTANQAGDDPDQWFHGTGVWSILGGYMPGGIVGPAYNASFVLAKTHDITLSPEEDEDHWLAAAEWADSIGVDVVSSSMVIYYSYETHDGETTPVALATRVMSSHGILLVCAMGNNGPDPGTLWSPADCESILAVGSVDNANVISSFSSRGPSFDGRGKPDLVAQGENTVWADAGSTTGLGGENGTSLSTPLVSGVAALVQEAHPEWTAQQVRYALKSTADKASTPDSTTYGWGRPNAVKAIYQSTLGGPIFPKPFALISPTGSVATGIPMTFRWRRSVDPNPGDAVTYTLEVRRSTNGAMIFTTSSPDTFVQCIIPLTPGATYDWVVLAKDPANHTRPSMEPLQFTAAGSVTAVETPDGGPPRVLQFGSRPNPFETTTQIEFRIQGGPVAPVSLRIYDSRGRLVRTLLENATRTAASVPWDGKANSGTRVASGVYYYRLEMGSARFIRRLILLK